MYKKNYRIFNKVYDRYLPVCRRNVPGETTARADDVYTNDSIHGVCFPILMHGKKERKQNMMHFIFL